MVTSANSGVIQQPGVNSPAQPFSGKGITAPQCASTSRQSRSSPADRFECSVSAQAFVSCWLRSANPAHIGHRFSLSRSTDSVPHSTHAFGSPLTPEAPTPGQGPFRTSASWQLLVSREAPSQARPKASGRKSSTPRIAPPSTTPSLPWCASSRVLETPDSRASNRVWASSTAGASTVKCPPPQ